ncbi:MAG: fused MFS/spermidine synthase [Peptococcaceae bacterium]|nr:fused MFS/spermidine synthase [Peptococcaceae bacterium]
MTKKLLAGNKYFLYITAFFSGMSIMAIELGASRLLAPYFSSSQIVWTVIIGTIMIALALGHVIGGRAVDKNPDPARLYSRLLIAALWTAAIPFAGKYVIAGVSLLLAMLVTGNFLVWASLVSCFLIFVFPLLLLGTVSPALIKFSVDNLEENGKIVGQLEAVNTVGSIIGTFLPTFVTIPAVGTAATFLIFAAILAAISGAYFFSAHRHKARGAVSLALILGLLFLPVENSFAFWESDLLYEGESIYNYLQVKETERSVIFSTNVLEGVQSILMKDGTLTGLYYEYALAGPLITGVPAVSAAGARPNGGETAAPAGGPGQNSGETPAQNLLILGLGTGTYAALCQKYFPSLSVEGVEIDAKIVALAEEYFQLPENVAVSVYDGRAYLQNSGLYDLILVDAYQDITIPFQMSSLEFFTAVKAHLREGGVLMVNMNMRSGKEGAINDYLQDTIRSVFDHVYTMVLPNITNTILFAAEGPGLRESLAEGLSLLPDGEPLKDLLINLRDGLREATPGPLILTDDKAPVELLGIRVIDELIANNLQYYQGILKRDGIDGLLRGMGL